MSRNHLSGGGGGADSAGGADIVARRECPGNPQRALAQQVRGFVPIRIKPEPEQRPFLQHQGVADAVIQIRRERALIQRL